MSAVSSTKFLLTICAVVALSFCFESDADAQGVRIGNFFQAGGGQGFRLGGPRAGMHFGGGQGASIGTQRFGMRFGNGQGARFGGANYGMQFGGGQGTQIGELRTTTSGTPGTYYYGDVRNGGYYAQPMGQPLTVAQPQSTIIGQQSIQQPTPAGQVGPSMIPSTVASPNGQVIQAQANEVVGAASNTPSTGAVVNPGAANQVDIARQPTPVAKKSESVSGATQQKSILITEEAEAPVPTTESTGSGNKK